MEISYKQLMPHITTFILDVDGVLTNGMVTVFPNGDLIRQMNIKDGYALKTAIDAGYNRRSREFDSVPVWIRDGRGFSCNHF